MKTSNQKTRFTHINRNNRQQGGTILGFVLGLVAGLGIAFGITFYLNKNTPQERPGVRAPNLPLTIKPSAAPNDGESTAPGAPVDLNKPLQGKSATPASSDPIGDLVSGKKPVDSSAANPAAAKTDSVYFLQAGAFTKRADADAQKASLAIQGIQSQLSEVTSEENTLWRVRVGPFNSVEESNPVRDKLNSVGIKPTLIKVSKS
jgi:cell division protein FtsN